MIKITSDEQILNQETRKQILDEIVNGSENITRRFTELRKHEIYRDKHKKWIMQALIGEGYKNTTLYQMQNRASNISICKKIVNKLAQTYVGGISRKVEDANSQECIDLLSDELDINTKLIKVDRYKQLFRNAFIYPVPIKSIEQSYNGKDKYDIVLRILAPWQYDVIEDPYDLTKPMVVILSDFHEQYKSFCDFNYDYLKGAEGRHSKGNEIVQQTNRRDDKLADSRNDKGMGEDVREFIWWSNNYHFTTDQKGKILTDKIPFPDFVGKQALSNPINMLPFINVTTDQDEFFWAIGGEDVIEGSILINKQITDINFITFTQGWGQLVISAKDVPKLLEGGPDNALIFDLQPDDPTPQVFYASSNPPIESWLATVKSYLALLLSTNDLSPRNISANLDINNLASGIAMIIEQSESLADIQESQKLFQDKEPLLWEVIRRWHELYYKSESLVEYLQMIKPFKDSNVKLKFHQVRPPISESEHLENLEKRKNMGLNTMVELLQKDNPDLTKEEAKAKAEEIINEKKQRAQQMVGQMFKNQMDNKNANNQLETSPSIGNNSGENENQDEKSNSETS